MTKTTHQTSNTSNIEQRTTIRLHNKTASCLKKHSGGKSVHLI